MELKGLSMPATAHNVAVVRRFAKDKGYALRKLKNEDLYMLLDMQFGKCIKEEARLDEIYDYLCSIDD